MAMFLTRKKNCRIQGCKFEEYHLITEDERVINKLRNCSFYGKLIFEAGVNDDKVAHLRAKPVNELSTEELELMLKEKQEVVKDNEEVINYDNLTYKELLDMATEKGYTGKSKKKVDIIAFLKG